MKSSFLPMKSLSQLTLMTNYYVLGTVQSALRKFLIKPQTHFCVMPLSPPGRWKMWGSERFSSLYKATQPASNRTKDKQGHGHYTSTSVSCLSSHLPLILLWHLIYLLICLSYLSYWTVRFLGVGTTDDSVLALQFRDPDGYLEEKEFLQ